jgi:membrane-associated protein
MFELISTFGYWGIFATIFGEIGLMLFPLPGDTLLFSTGILVDKGSFNYTHLLIGCFLASTIGGHVGYYIGTLVDEETLLNNKYYKVKDEHLQKTKKFFQQYGAWAIIFSRYVPAVRSFISQLLGIINYDKKKFFIYNIIASFIWPLFIITAGLFLGKMFPQAIYYAEFVIAFLFILVSIPLLKEIFHQTKHHIKNRLGQ